MKLLKNTVFFLFLIIFISNEVYAFGRKKTPPPSLPPPITHPEAPVIIPPPADSPIDNFSPKIPFSDRPLDSVKGSDFLLNAAKSGTQRENQIYEEVIHGNIPEFLKKWIPIQSKIKLNSGEDSELTFFVLPDYLSIGENSNFVRIPTTPITAQKIMNYYDLTLPTRKMVQLIFEHSQSRFQPAPLTPGSEMSSNTYYQSHQNKIEAQRMNNNFTLGELFIGIKKDVVISAQLKNRPDRVAIFGWHYPNGKPIQNLNVSSHSNTYVDYSHGVRLVSTEVLLNGKVYNIYDIWADPKYSIHLSDEGVLLDPKAAYNF